MSEVIRVTCPHTVVKTFFRDSGIWTTVISEVQMVSDSDSGAFIEHRYPVRCEACGVVADVNQSALNDALDFIDAHGIHPVTLSIFAGVVGRLDKVRHGKTRTSQDG
jgi:hypothetical protein